MKLKPLFVGFSAISILTGTYLVAHAWGEFDSFAPNPDVDAVVAVADQMNAGEISRQRIENMTIEQLKGLHYVVWAMENPRAVNEIIEKNMTSEEKELRARILKSWQESSAPSEP